MPDDGYGEVGGNGSVEWKFDVGNVMWAESTPKKDNEGHRQGGAAKNSANAKFTLSLKARRNQNVAVLAADLANAANWTIVGDRVEFLLDIEKRTPDQIRISWT